MLPTDLFFIQSVITCNTAVTYTKERSTQYMSNEVFFKEIAEHITVRYELAFSRDISLNPLLFVVSTYGPKILRGLPQGRSLDPYFPLCHAILRYFVFIAVVLSLKVLAPFIQGVFLGIGGQTSAYAGLPD